MVFKGSDKMFNLNRLKSLLREYLIGFLLMPWIWVWGALITIFSFVIFFQTSQFYDLYQFELVKVFSREINLLNITLLVIFFIFGNYTLDFFTRKTKPRIGFLVFYLSCFLVGVLILISWPHFVISLTKV